MSSEAERLIAELDALIGGGAGAAAPAAPAAAAVAEPMPREEPASHLDGPLKVLVAEDSKDYRRLVTCVLADAGYEVLEAADGLEALRLARERQPHALVLDFEMPGLNGYELIQELRKEEETRKVPVLMLTGAPNRRHLREMNLDISAFLEKPSSNAELLAAVADALGGRRPAVKAEEAIPAARTVPEGVRGDGPPPDALPATPDTPAELESFGAEEKVEEAELQIEEQKKEAEEEAAGLDVLANESPIVNRVNRLITRAVELGASDIHIEPQERAIAVRVRVDGSLQALAKLPLALAPQVAARVKIMSNLVITERRRPQDGQIRAVVKGKKVEFRVSTLPSIHGEKIVMRILGGAKIKDDIKDLGFSDRDLEAVERSLETPHGLILVTGPTGSGKTTTLYTMIRRLNLPDLNVMTVEDPVEYELPGITQVHVKPHIGLTFESVLRSFLRQDPDIMLVGEIRDLETAEIAVKAAITGHLVLSTVHTNSAPAALSRMTHMGLAPFLLADSLRLVIAQRLLRRVCQRCKAPQAPPEHVLRLVGPEDSPRLKGAVAGKGCKACNRSGYAGRFPVFEVMEVRTQELRELILTTQSAEALARRAREEGMTSLRQAALDAVAAGQTTVEEALTIILSE